MYGYDDLVPVERRRRSVFTTTPVRIRSSKATPRERDAASELALGIADDGMDDLRDGWMPPMNMGKFPTVRSRAEPSPPVSAAHTPVQHIPTRHHFPYFTYAIIITNLIMFLATVAVAGFRFEPLSTNPLIGPNTNVLDRYARQRNMSSNEL
jgi:hypothetical protein